MKVREAVRSVGCALWALGVACGCGGSTSGRGGGAETGNGGTDGGVSDSGAGGSSNDTGGTTSSTGGVATGGVFGSGGTATGGSIGAGGSTGAGGTSAGCVPTSAVPCLPGQTEPCAGFSTGYDGDEYCMVPPTNGFQIHIGPTSYDDPSEVAKYVLPPGAEQSFCVTVHSPNDTDVLTRHRYVHMRPGGMNTVVFSSTSAATDSTGPEACGANGTDLAFAVPSPVADASMIGDAPENAGVAEALPAHQALVVNPYFFNMTDTAILMELWINFVTVPADQVTELATPVQWLGGIGASVPPGTTQIVTSAASACSAPAAGRVLGLFANTGANTRRVTTSVASYATVFEDYDWRAPTMFRFDSVTLNPAPDPVAMRSGALSGILGIDAAAPASWECEIQNDSNVSLVYQREVYSTTACNVFGEFVATSGAGGWQCFSF